MRVQASAYWAAMIAFIRGRNFIQWIGKFCAHLMKRRPDMGLRMAVHEALAAYPDAAHLQPEDAAMLLAAGLPPIDPLPSGRDGHTNDHH